jgi:hypothetical protein
MQLTPTCFKEAVIVSWLKDLRGKPAFGVLSELNLANAERYHRGRDYALRVVERAQSLDLRPLPVPGDSA